MCQITCFLYRDCCHHKRVITLCPIKQKERLRPYYKAQAILQNNLTNGRKGNIRKPQHQGFFASVFACLCPPPITKIPVPLLRPATRWSYLEAQPPKIAQHYSCPSRKIQQQSKYTFDVCPDCQYKQDQKDKKSKQSQQPQQSHSNPSDEMFGLFRSKKADSRPTISRPMPVVDDSAARLGQRSRPSESSRHPASQKPSSSHKSEKSQKPHRHEQKQTSSHAAAASKDHSSRRHASERLPAHHQRLQSLPVQYSSRSGGNYASHASHASHAPHAPPHASHASHSYTRSSPSVPAGPSHGPSHSSSHGSSHAYYSSGRRAAGGTSSSSRYARDTAPTTSSASRHRQDSRRDAGQDRMSLLSETLHQWTSAAPPHPNMVKGSRGRLQPNPHPVYSINNNDYF